MRVLFFGTYDAEAMTRVRVLQEGLAALGDQVEECNVPLALDNAWRVRILERPWLLPVLGYRLCTAWARLLARARGTGEADAIVVGYLGHFDVHLARMLWRRQPVVLDHLVSGADTALDRRSTSSWLLRDARPRRPGRPAGCGGPVRRHGGEPRAAPSRVSPEDRRRPRRGALEVVPRAAGGSLGGTAARRLLRQLHPAARRHRHRRGDRPARGGGAPGPLHHGGARTGLRAHARRRRARRER